MVIEGNNLSPFKGPFAGVWRCWLIDFTSSFKFTCFLFFLRDDSQKREKMINMEHHDIIIQCFILLLVRVFFAPDQKEL